MSKVLNIIGVILIIQSVGGVANAIWWSGDGFSLVNRLALFEGYEVFANLIVGVLAVVLIVLVDRSAGDDA
ncbi:hypothetical protein [Nonomuraea sp. NPDC050310]|uniref:hypothetical protein n=1 Tax=unclassified Nonomuraea TaxID=2593643 RepID=UPI0033FF0980